MKANKSMKRCRHRKNIQITEQVEAFQQHSFENGTVMHYLYNGDILKPVVVECLNCGYHRIYSQSNLPKWIENAITFMRDFRDLTETEYSEIPDNYEMKGR